ncbi:FAD-binding protein [Altererythrobacter luteolus]|uniref:FAD-binding protein n=1 Tax=Pontixanthobacter luteolus TaxID=295089 RepID=A0A6I4UXR7_9SPHN|nr:FAD-binding oxidoreductase [Pontixanthobacter luteolus]MXP46345.1 FAD-binding protein [Pontixanthobacter luteolus]
MAEKIPHQFDHFLSEAGSVLGPKGLTSNYEDMEPWLTDWRGRYSGSALAMASPASTAQVAALVRICTRHGVAIVPQGGNSGMSGGATPDEGGKSIILSLRRMNAIRALNEEERSVTCDAGVILQTLHEAAETKRLRFPLTLGGKGSATIGGLISTNAGGTQVLRHGTMRAQVAGLEAVLPDGQIFNSLTPLKKDNRGFDLKQLLIGSEGTLGIVTGATLRLLPEIGGRAVMWAGLSSILDARKLLLHFQDQANEQLEGFEVIPQHSLQAVLNHQPEQKAPLAEMHPWNALIELAAPKDKPDALPDLAETILGSALELGLIEDATIAASETQAEQMWHLRDSISSAERAIGPAMQHDISVPVDKMADFVAAALPAVQERFAETKAVAFGHLGDGNVHFHVIAPPNAVPGQWEKAEGKKISSFVHDLVTEWGGSISAEHGIGQMKLAELERLGDPVSISLMQTIKNALDPQCLFNPGKLVPLARSGTNP